MSETDPANLFGLTKHFPTFVYVLMLLPRTLDQEPRLRVYNVFEENLLCNLGRRRKALGQLPGIYGRK